MAKELTITMTIEVKIEGLEDMPQEQIREHVADALAEVAEKVRRGEGEHLLKGLAGVN